MELRLVDGDYVYDDWGALQKVSGEKELIQRILFKLTAKRGAFPLMPELGSRLYLLYREKNKNLQSAAEQYIREALAGEKALELVSAEVTRGDEALDIEMKFLYKGDELALNITV